MIYIYRGEYLKFTLYANLYLFIHQRDRISASNYNIL
jgi:hypothetical protein